MMKILLSLFHVFCAHFIDFLTLANQDFFNCIGASFSVFHVLSSHLLIFGIFFCAGALFSAFVQLLRGFSGFPAFARILHVFSAD